MKNGCCVLAFVQCHPWYMGEGRRWGDFLFTFNLLARSLVHTTSWGTSPKNARTVYGLLRLCKCMRPILNGYLRIFIVPYLRFNLSVKKVVMQDTKRNSFCIDRTLTLLLRPWKLPIDNGESHIIVRK